MGSCSENHSPSSPYTIMKLNFITSFLAITTTTAFGKIIPNNAPADLVLGQVNFTTNTSPAVTANSLDDPAAIAMDPMSGKVFVADGSNNRVLRYANAAALQNGAPAEAVFGQPNFTTAGTNPVASLSMNFPSALFFDRFKRLWVADQGNNRVLMFSFADIRDSEAHPDKVFGQPDFNTVASAPASATKMRNPSGLWVDKDDRLWVADQSNNRILRFDSVSNNPAANSTADGVLGQPDFISTTSGLSPNKLDNPESVTVSATGQLYIADFNNNRILRFDSAATSSGLVNASAVLGQVDFTTGSPGISATKLEVPAGVFITPDDSLWITDYGNHRMLHFKNASTKGNGAAADGFIGQPDFITNTPGVTSQKLRFPYYAAFVDPSGNLWVPDNGNNRVLRFPADNTKPTLVLTAPLPKKTTSKKSVTIKGTATDAIGVAKVEFRVGTGPLQAATGVSPWKIKPRLKKGKNKITVIATDTSGNTSLDTIIKIRRD
jgi:sugar lactone lactonase YvrE